MRIRTVLFAAALAFALASPEQVPAQPAPAPEAPQEAPAIYDAEVVARYPHDPGAFTQGLLWHEGSLYESTGLVGRSEIRKVDPATGDVLARRAIPETQFGEGLALWNGELISLTWKSGTIHRWRLDGLAPIRSDAGYPFEGWGLARMEDALVASDGSSTLRVLDPDDYTVRRTIPVTIEGRPLAMLNELEVVDGLILANVWLTGFVVGIDPQDGAVRRVIDLRPLQQLNAVAGSDAVLNGIAWDADGRRLFVTGKLWPWLYEIRLVQRESGGG